MKKILKFIVKFFPFGYITATFLLWKMNIIDFSFSNVTFPVLAMILCGIVMLICIFARIVQSLKEEFLNRVINTQSKCRQGN